MLNPTGVQYKNPCAQPKTICPIKAGQKLPKEKYFILIPITDMIPTRLRDFIKRHWDYKIAGMPEIM